MTYAHINSPQVQRIAAEVSTSAGVDRKSLLTRTLLHLPRISDPAGIVALSLAREECKIQASILADSLTDGYEKGAKHPRTPRLDDLRFSSLTTDAAQQVMDNFHFLRSFRQDARYFGLVDKEDESVAAACGVAKLRWPRLAELIDITFGVSPSQLVDLCRLYSFSHAPANSISRLLSKVHKEARKEGHNRLLCTLVDRQLGYTGASYLAANWIKLGEVERGPYRYVDGMYMTAGQLNEQFGTMESLELARILGDRFEISKPPIANSLVLGYPLDRHTRRSLLQLNKFVLRYDGVTKLER